MNKFRDFINSVHIVSKILFAIWLISLVIEIKNQHKVYNLLEKSVIFLLPPVMIELCKNNALENCNFKFIKVLRNTKIISRVLVYNGLFCWIISGETAEGYACFHLLFLFPAVMIEYIKNDALRKENCHFLEITENNEVKNVNNNIDGCVTLTYADLVISGEIEKTQPIPKLEAEIINPSNDMSLDDDAYQLNFDKPYYFKHFVKDMKKYEHKVGFETDFVPFMQYYPTYNEMN